MSDESEFKQLTTKLKDAITRVEGIGSDIDGRFREIEQKVSRRGAPGGHGGAFGTKTYGDAIVDSDGFKALASSPSQKGVVRARIKRSELKTVAPAITSGGTSAGALVPPDNRFNSIVEIARQSLPIRALLGQTTTTSNQVIYPKQLTRSLNAAGVAEGALKPQSDATFVDQTVPIRTLAHWFRCSRQIMDDAPAFRSFINDEAEFGLRLLEETQFLYGDNTGQNLWGLIPQAEALSVPAKYVGTGTTALDQVAFGIEQIVAAALPVDGLILNPVDWIELLRIKDGQGRYMSGSPFSAETISMIWNLNIALSLSMVQGTFLLGSFQSNCRIFDRDEVEVMMSTEDQNNFVTNQVTILAEERTALTVLRPSGLVTGPLYPS